MARLRIPSGDYDVFRKIAELDEVKFGELVEAIKSIGTSVVQMDIAAPLSENLKSINPDDIKGIARTINSLHVLKSSGDETAQIVANNVKETIEYHKPAVFPLDKLGILTERIQKILTTVSSVGLIAKARNVMADQDRVFCGVRILSDVRPVFGDTPDSIAANVIVHTLNISYHQNDEHKEFYAAMSIADLKALKKAVERAEKKSEAIKLFIQKSGIRYLEDGE